MSVFGYNFLWRVRGPKFDEVGADGIRRIGYRAGKDIFVQIDTTPSGYRVGEWFEGAPEIVIWRINPDGTAIYSNPWDFSIGVEVGMCRYRDGNCRRPPFSTYKDLELASPKEGWPGSPGYTYNFSKEGFDLFRMVASQFPNGAVARGIGANGIQWNAWNSWSGYNHFNW